MPEKPIPSCPPPHPDPDRPKLKTPTLACDVHAHVFGPASKYPYAPTRGYTPPDATLESYLRLHEILGIERAVLTQPSVYGVDNSAMLDAMAKHPGPIKGIAALAQDTNDAELARLNDAGVTGIRVNLADKGGMPFDDMNAVRDFALRIKDMGWHLELLVHVDSYADLYETFADFPIEISVGHLGYMKTGQGIDNTGFQDFLKLMREGRCWAKLTGAYRITAAERTPYADVTPFARALIEANPDRVLWARRGRTDSRLARPAKFFIKKSFQSDERAWKDG